MGAPEREQSDGAAADEEERVEIRVATPPAPVQTGARETVGADELQNAETLAPENGLPHVHARGDGLVRRTARAVIDHHDPATRQRSGERDPPRERGHHGLAERTGEVDPSVTRPEEGGRRLEHSHHLRLRPQGPHPHRNRIHGSTERSSRSCQAEQRDHQQGDDDARHRTADPDRGGEWCSHGHHGARTEVPGAGAGFRAV